MLLLMALLLLLLPPPPAAERVEHDGLAAASPAAAAAAVPLVCDGQVHGEAELVLILVGLMLLRVGEQEHAQVGDYDQQRSGSIQIYVVGTGSHKTLVNGFM